MKIEINEQELESMIVEKVDALTDTIIHDKIQTLLFDKIDGLFTSYGGFKWMVEKYIKESIDAQIPKFTEDEKDKACKKIADEIAYDLHKSIIGRIGYALLPDEEKGEDE